MKLATLLAWAHKIWLGFWNRAPYARKLTFEHKSVTKMHRTYLLNEHIFNDRKGKGFQWYFLLEFKVKHFVLRSRNTKKRFNGKQDCEQWRQTFMLEWERCILSILNSQGDFGVWLFNPCFHSIVHSLPITCYIIVVAHGLGESWEFKIHKYFQLQVQCMINYVNMLNGDHFMNKLSFTSILTI